MSNTFGIGFTIGAAFSSSFSSAFSTMEQKIKRAASNVDALNNKEKKAAADASAIDKRSLDLQEQYSELYHRREALAQSMTELRNRKAGGGKRAPGQLKTAIAEYKALGVQLNDLSAAYRKAHLEAQEFGMNSSKYAAEQTRRTQELARANAALARYAQQKAGADKRRELRGQMMDTVAPALAVAAPVKWAIDYESSMADAAKTIDGMRDSAGNLTPKYYQMETAIKAMGRELPLTHEQLAGLFAAGGQQGMSGVEDLQEFTTMAAHMSVAFGMSTEEAADAIGGYRSAMHLSLPEARSMLDLMNQFANTSSATEKGIADVVRRIGPLGNVGGVAAKPMTALAATLDSMKVSPETAATGIKNLILAMTSGSAATKAQKEAFASLGISTVELAKAMQKDGSAAIISVLEKIKALPKHQQLSIMQEIFGKESLGAITPLLDSLDQVKKNLTIAGDESQYAGAMQKEFENRSRTTANALILMSNRIREAGINIGSVLLPPLNTLLTIIGPLVSGIAEFAQKHQGLTTLVVGAATGLVAFRIAAIGAAYASTFMGGGLLNISKILGIVIPGMATATTASQVLSLGVRGIGVALRFAFGPVGLLVSAATLAFGYLWEKCEWFREGFLSLWEGLKSVPGALADAFTQALARLGEGIGRFFESIPGFSQISGFFKDAWSGLKDFAGGDSKKPVAVAASVAQTVANAIAKPLPHSANPMVSSSSTRTSPPDNAPASQAASMPDGAASGYGMPGPGMGGSGMTGSGPSFNLSFNLNGMTDSGFATRVVDALKSHRGDFERIISDIVHDQQRVSYAS